MLRVGATVQLPPMSFTSVTSFSRTVARAVGSAVQVPQDIVTAGAVVYPKPPDTILATLPVASDVAEATTARVGLALR